MDTRPSPAVTGVDALRALPHLGGRAHRPMQGRSGADPMPVKKETQYHTWYWVAAIVAMMLIQAVFAAYTQVQTIPYSEFQDDLKAGKIAEVRVSGNYIQGKFKEPDPKGYTDFITTRV